MDAVVAVDGDAFVVVDGVFSVPYVIAHGCSGGGGMISRVRRRSWVEQSAGAVGDAPNAGEVEGHAHHPVPVHGHLLHDVAG